MKSAYSENKSDQPNLDEFDPDEKTESSKEQKKQIDDAD